MANYKISDLTAYPNDRLGASDLFEVSYWNGSAFVSRKLSPEELVNSIPAELIIACSDETTALTTGTDKVTFRMPYTMELTEVRASLTSAGSTSGTTTIDINENGTTVLSTKLTIDFDERTSTTAATPAVISDSLLLDDSVITIDIDAVTTGANEAGLKVTLIGYRSSAIS